MAYLKPQSPIKNGEDHVYPLTTYDQIIMSDNSRWDGDVGVKSVDGKTGAVTLDYPVDSVNGKTDTVNLTYSDVGAAAASHTHATPTSLQYINSNPITTTDDTVENWKSKGMCYCFYNKTGCLIDQPSQYGILVSFGYYNEVHQIWMTQASGNLYQRGGNASGWSGTWRKMIDSTNFSLSGTTLTITTT